MNSCTFTVFGPPVPKKRPVFSRNRGGLARTPEKTRAWETKVRLCAYTAGLRPVQGLVAVSIAFYLPTLRPCDIDNLAKSIMDGLNGAAFKDDSQVWELHCSKNLDRENPRAVVVVHELPPAKSELRITTCDDVTCGHWRCS
jgi:crossover junction endodeoxyribonuclease RusA